MVPRRHPPSLASLWAHPLGRCMQRASTAIRHGPSRAPKCWPAVPSPWGCLPAPEGGGPDSLGTGVGKGHRPLRGQIPVVSRGTCLIWRLFASKSRFCPQNLPNGARLWGQVDTPKNPQPHCDGSPQPRVAGPRGMHGLNPTVNAAVGAPSEHGPPTSRAWGAFRGGEATHCGAQNGVGRPLGSGLGLARPGSNRPAARTRGPKRARMGLGQFAPAPARGLPSRDVSLDLSRDLSTRECLPAPGGRDLTF